MRWNGLKTGRFEVQRFIILSKIILLKLYCHSTGHTQLTQTEVMCLEKQTMKIHNEYIIKGDFHNVGTMIIVHYIGRSIIESILSRGLLCIFPCTEPGPANKSIIQRSTIERHLRGS